MWWPRSQILVESDKSIEYEKTDLVYGVWRFKIAAGVDSCLGFLHVELRFRV